MYVRFARTKKKERTQARVGGLIRKRRTRWICYSYLP